MQIWKENYLRITAIAAINLIFFIIYLIHTNKLQIILIRKKDFKFSHMLPCLSLNFDGYPKKLATLNFEKVKDDFNELNIACFKYQNIMFSIQKYTNNPSLNYNVFVDIRDCHRERKHPQDIALKAIKALQLNKILVSLISMELGSSFKFFERYRKN